MALFSNVCLAHAAVEILLYSLPTSDVNYILNLMEVAGLINIQAFVPHLLEKHVLVQENMLLEVRIRDLCPGIFT